MSEDRESLGQVIKALREAAGLSRSELVARTEQLAGQPSPGGEKFVKVSLEMLAKVEQGKKSPSPPSLRTIANALDVNTADLTSRASAWTALAAAGVAASALRSGAVTGGILGIGAAVGALGSAPVALPAMATTAYRVKRSRDKERGQIEELLRARLDAGDLSDEQLQQVATALDLETDG